PRDFAIVERNVLRADHLIRLVTLAGNQYQVSVARLVDRHFNGHATIRLGVIALTGFLDSRDRLRNDGAGILRSRIVAGHDDHVAALRRRFTHHRTLLAIAFAATTEYRDDAPRLEVSRRRQDVTQGVVGVRV